MGSTAILSLYYSIFSTIFVIILAVKVYNMDRKYKRENSELLRLINRLRAAHNTLAIKYVSLYKKCKPLADTYKND